MKTTPWEEIVAHAISIDGLDPNRGEDPLRLAQLVLDFDREVVKKPINGVRTKPALASPGMSNPRNERSAA